MSASTAINRAQEIPASMDPMEECEVGAASQMEEECEAAPASLASQMGECEAAPASLTLLRDGVAVVPLLSAAELATHRAAVLHDMRAFPEYKAAFHAQFRGKSQMPEYVMGGFGALGNPSSFHSPGILALRLRVSEHIRATVLPAYVALQKQADPRRWLTAQQQQQPHVETLMDRLSVRRTGTSTGTETWHIDQSPVVAGREAHPDVVFGGWINLDATQDQFFSCKQGTHNRPYSGQSGFVGLSAAEQAAAKRSPTDTVRIPPGHFMIFQQTLTHEVLPRKAAYDSVRLYVGFRLTTSTRALFDECAPDKQFQKVYPRGFDFQRDVVHGKGVPPLPSGQYPPMFSTNHWICPYSPVEWSRDAFKEAYITHTTAGTNKRTVARFMSGGHGEGSAPSDSPSPLHPVYSHSTTPLQLL